MHSKSSTTTSQRTPSLLDPCYHLDKSSPVHSHSHSPCPSTLSRHRDTTWVDETGEHDPDFRPFAVPTASPFSSPLHSHHDSPRRRSLDLPTKGARPLTLEPGLYAALRAHERVLAEQQQLQLQVEESEHKRCESRRPSFLGLPRCRSRTSVKDNHSNELVFSDDSDDDSLAYSPPPLPALEIDSGSDEEDEQDEKPSHDHDLKYQLAGLHLRVDLALFRAKKRLRRRVGLD